jgi:dihydroorotate dehydrogenase (NAD+) catalytic subunit
VAEYAEVVRRLSDVEGVDGIELNISCPNIKEGGIAFGTDIKMACSVVEASRKATKLTLITKLSPNVPAIGVFAKAVEEAGSDAISLINTIPAMVIDVEKRRPVLANVVGGLSGPAVHPVAVRLVWEAAKAVKIPIIGMGGITGTNDALEFFIAGATAVAVGTANFTDPATALSVISGIEDYLVRHGMKKIKELTGSLSIPVKKRS